jgi:hypothetical protein
VFADGVAVFADGVVVLADGVVVLASSGKRRDLFTNSAADSKPILHLT